MIAEKRSDKPRPLNPLTSPWTQPTGGWVPRPNFWIRHWQYWGKYNKNTQHRSYQ